MKIICRDSIVPGIEELSNGAARHYIQNENAEKIYRVPRLIGLLMIPYLKIMWDYIEVTYD